MRPLVSVVMPVWNGEEYLASAIESILAQTFSNFEFIIVDDGSSDRTPTIVQRYPDPRIRLLRLSHGGIVNALNTGIAEARTGLIARMDADDVAESSRLAKQLDALNQRPDAVLCHTDVHEFGELSGRSPHSHLPRSRALTAAQLCLRCPIIHPTVMFRKTAFLAAGGYHPEERHAEDFGLWGRLIPRGKVVGLPQQLLQLRVHSGSISRQKQAVQLALTRTIATRHCQIFFRLNQAEAGRAHQALVGSTSKPLPEWLWFCTACLPHLEWQSVELWAWAASQTLRRLLRRRKP